MPAIVPPRLFSREIGTLMIGRVGSPPTSSKKPLPPTRRILKSTTTGWEGYGRRAETANPLSAPMLASKARKAFEKSVELDERNLEAINDLFSYYMEAPGFLGGGLDKGGGLAARSGPGSDRVSLRYGADGRKAQGIQDSGVPFPVGVSRWRRSRSAGPSISPGSCRNRAVQESEVVFAQAEKIASQLAPR